MHGDITVPPVMHDEPGLAGLNTRQLSTEDHTRLMTSLELTKQARQVGTVRAWQDAGGATVAAYQQRDPSMPLGVEKLLVLQAGECGEQLLEQPQGVAESLPFLEFAYREVVDRGWGPNGNSTPLGRYCTYLTAMYAQADMERRSAEEPRRRGLFGRHAR